MELKLPPRFHTYQKNFDESKKHSAIIVGAPYGGVREQGAGIYAQNMDL
jgi:hypothetical protein